MFRGKLFGVQREDRYCCSWQVLACAGAKEEGAAGAVKGFAVGALGGAALMIGGAVQAVTQVDISQQRRWNRMSH